MVIAIIADIHDNIINLKKCLGWCAKKSIKKLICCGDITNSRTLNFLAGKFAGDIYLVKGNIELYNEYEVEKFDNVKYFKEMGEFKLDNKFIGICHQPYSINKLLARNKYDIIFYGHTHKPWLEERDNVIIVNPGTLAGTFFKATFAVWDTVAGKIDLIILDNIR
ncbi:hypothetical protein CO115_04210 [Candidatus Falkowbacteria bacterium CG_4_9_14_3_um_filter_36_9]|uniref:Phosphoesterase n=1 Tax=Candidatus Falkowbacteria bacterium CG02_land_8_20_14_3_00_36_14 TaxID=1974560 RepID=A0A2M7DP15_9BACT|nr:MAG: hypothetical protein COS18_02650 [Candidatus Falkowbacteria bacterium CG02_land_8_20_14_3_00_36_14]PIX11219.1 MAG: hypothetical protein COZ73_03240 [Candidatus Falkowbacteria bacterium CG_4_8_14_3_um_filter_36_11]PJA10087.1 MAG: hypothetical protein COX67_05575 [Candidatus Falkowbacteria bacterium CG_4_10_14_0_2_um_filter_36_22]PJB18571.1 MAG: hypothetical protein CO115_04210 [Candidatus Falkowbacteria bacterium CG_4_9_14_3_um_filter_36_9]